MSGILLAIGYTFLFLWAIRHVGFFKLSGLGTGTLSAVFILKLVAGTILWSVYTYHYTDRSTADLYKYFDDSAVLFSALPHAPMDYLRMLFGIGNDTPYFSENYYAVMNNWYREYEGNLYNDSHTLIRFNAFVRLFSFGHLHVHTVFVCFLSLIGLVGMYRAFTPYFGGKETALAACLFFVPSVVFWGSGVMKESLLLFALGMLVWQVFRAIRQGPGIWGFPVIAACVILLFFLKFYVLVSMVPGFIALIWCGRKKEGAWWRYGMVLLVCGIIALNIHHVIPGFKVMDVLFWKYRDFIGLAERMESGSFVHPPPLSPDLWSFLKFAPYAVFIVFVGPLLNLDGGVMAWMAASETLALFLVLFGLLRYRKPMNEVHLPLVWFCLSFVVLLALMIGYTTPVMGAVVRYRVPLLPFLMLAALCFTDMDRLRRILPRFMPHRHAQ